MVMLGVSGEVKERFSTRRNGRAIGKWQDADDFGADDAWMKTVNRDVYAFQLASKLNSPSQDEQFRTTITDPTPKEWVGFGVLDVVPHELVPN